MIPLVGFADELKNQVSVVHRVASEVMEKKGVKFKYLVGTMIEVPRGALTADEIAETAEFFSFGTNDLTQTGLGMSRDDAGSFLGQYKDLDILPQNPFASIDAVGVGQLVEIGVQKGRSANKNLKLGVCGEHGGDPASIEFFHNAGLDYVSCSPSRSSCTISCRTISTQIAYTSFHLIQSPSNKVGRAFLCDFLGLSTM